MAEEEVIRWTARLSLLCYLIFLWLSVGNGTTGSAIRRAWWTGGALIMVLHLIAAFHLAHHWSHHHAVADTARQTDQVLGWEFGQGVYFNYLFVAIWIADAVWWWVAPGQYARRPSWLSSVVHGYLLFIVINACIVFESGVTRWTALLASAMLLARMAGRRHASPEPPG